MASTPLRVLVPDIEDGPVTVRVDGGEPVTYIAKDGAVAVKDQAEADHAARLLGGTVEGKP